MTDVAKPEKIRCDACPVMCYIAEGNSGACDRYANHGGELVRLKDLSLHIEQHDADGGVLECSAKALLALSQQFFGGSKFAYVPGDAERTRHAAEFEGGRHEGRVAKLDGLGGESA